MSLLSRVLFKLENETQKANSVKYDHNQLISRKDIVVFIEVQTGDYFDEDDIIRYEDAYMRSMNN